MRRLALAVLLLGRARGRRRVRVAVIDGGRRRPRSPDAVVPAAVSATRSGRGALLLLQRRHTHGATGRRPGGRWRRRSSVGLAALAPRRRPRSGPARRGGPAHRLRGLLRRDRVRDDRRVPARLVAQLRVPPASAPTAMARSGALVPDPVPARDARDRPAGGVAGSIVDDRGGPGGRVERGPPAPRAADLPRRRRSG